MTNKQNILKFIILGEKGGVGKTWFSLLLIEFLRQKFDRLPTIVDMDVSTPNVAKVYLKKHVERWSNLGSASDEKSKNIAPPKSTTRLEELLEDQISLNNDRSGEMGDNLREIMDISQETVVSMPSQSLLGLMDWMDRYRIDDNSSLSDLIFWWVSDGSVESLGLLEKFVYKYPSLKICLVLNKGSRDIDWTKYQLEKVSADVHNFIKAGDIKKIEIDLIGIAPKVLDRIQLEGLSFEDIVNSQSENKYFVNRFSSWLEKSYKEILSTGYVADVANEEAGDKHLVNAL
jgi:CobQ/CobB/MinD/ParA nucleotide binding domain